MSETQLAEKATGAPDAAITSPAEGVVNAEVKTEAQQIDWEKRHADSSREAHRLLEEKVKAETRAEMLERQLAESRKDPGFQFPNEEEYAKNLMNSADKSEKESLWEAKRDRHYFQSVHNLQMQIQALANAQRFSGQQNERAAIELNPTAKEAAEFCEQFPEMSALPIAEKIQRYNKIKPMLVPKTNGRDLSSVKASASAGMGSGAARMEIESSQNDADARAAGFPSHEAMLAVSKAKTAEEYKAAKLKYKITL